MLDPNQSRLFTDALRPPPGLRFVDVVGTTYSLDLVTLLTMPLHLALFSADRPMEEIMRDGVTLLEALRRTADRVTVFCDHSRILAPEQQHTLFPLLEPVVVEASAPSADGAFHPKVWLLRFQDPEGRSTRLRLLVLSRNLTDDRSWDLVLTLEGTPGTEALEDNRPLAGFIARLPHLARRPVRHARAESVRELAELAVRTDWELPRHFESVRFHALGLEEGKPWLPRRSGQLIVIGGATGPPLTAAPPTPCPRSPLPQHREEGTAGPPLPSERCTSPRSRPRMLRRPPPGCARARWPPADTDVARTPRCEAAGVGVWCPGRVRPTPPQDRGYT